MDQEILDINADGFLEPIRYRGLVKMNFRGYIFNFLPILRGSAVGTVHLAHGCAVSQTPCSEQHFRVVPPNDVQAGHLCGFVGLKRSLRWRRTNPRSISLVLPCFSGLIDSILSIPE